MSSRTRSNTAARAGAMFRSSSSAVSNGGAGAVQQAGQRSGRPAPCRSGPRPGRVPPARWTAAPPPTRPRAATRRRTRAARGSAPPGARSAARGPTSPARDVGRPQRSCPLRLGHLLAAASRRWSQWSQVRTKGSPGRCLGLGDLVLVVREDEVDAAGVDVEARAQVAHAHRGALDVPAGPARPDGRVPAAARPSRGPFQSAKSRTSSLLYSSASTRSPTRCWLGSSCASAP